MKKSKRSVDWQDRDIGPSEEMRLDLDEPDEDEILELEDVLELPEEEAPIDDETSAVDEDIDLNDLKLDFDADDKDFSQDDPTEDLSFNEGKLKAADPQRIDAPKEPDAKGEAEDFSLGFDETSFLVLDRKVGPGGDVDAIESPMEKMDEETAEDDRKPSIEDLVQQIEARLIEAVRQLVESKLPEIVRTLLREEIERVKKELEADRA